MSEDQQATLKAVFDKVNSRDFFACLIGMSLVKLKPGFARAVLFITAELFARGQQLTKRGAENR
jgi:hypothetical protein